MAVLIPTFWTRPLNWNRNAANLSVIFQPFGGWDVVVVEVISSMVKNVIRKGFMIQ